MKQNGSQNLDLDPKCGIVLKPTSYGIWFIQTDNLFHHKIEWRQNEGNQTDGTGICNRLPYLEI